ncbi:hypothetical protein [Microbispora sp. ATCC PTA-5024]|uniref:hypothetical protein n=1 Tax=Microbispora sp. ATCC PTA-5024 TaxID=316330 RepID=UPI0003DBA9A9|nr:hypothetical protein [Microbispora sp. ATCC PTA-5024]ETK30650.1 hypothetical protein MPTA5024_39130 [Microbispora sp. ATCC PTA-5024]
MHRTLRITVQGSARRRLATVAVTLAAGLAAVAGWTAPAAAASGPGPVMLTCRDFNGAGFINWDLLVQLNPDGTARSAEQFGDAYLTGLQVLSVERTGRPSIAIRDNGRSLDFHGDAILQAGIPGTSFNASGPAQSCSAHFTFPHPAGTYTNLTPTS